MNRKAALVIAGLAAVWLAGPALSEQARPPLNGLSKPLPSDAPANMIEVTYVEPTEAAHILIYDRMRKRQVLEELRDFLSPLRLQRRLRLTMRACGRANAFYSPARTEVTLCYEFIELTRRRAPGETTPEGVTFEDGVVAGIVSVLLHETSHAVFDILQIPVFGREEDAADQLAGFIMVQFGPGVARRLMAAKAHLWDQAGSKRPPRKKRDYADTHGTEYQRFYNILCVAYGHDPLNFQDYVKKNILPPARSRACRNEYRKLERAFRMLLLPHIHRERMEQVRRVDWLRPGDGKPD